jgi:sodium transport system permease protein
MKPWRVVWAKELRENARDRRTLLSAFVLGPVLGPLLFAILITVTLNRSVTSGAETITVPLDRPLAAPNLVAFLAGQGVETVPGPATLAAAEAAIRSGEQDLVMLLSDDYAAMLEAAAGARVTVVYDQSKTRAAARARRLQALIEAYSSQLAALRVLARGIDPGILRPLVVVEQDISTPASRSLLLLGMLTYFLLLAMLMGGFYLAIDSTAGERERGSLEPLLTTPVARGSLLLGKMGATLTYMAISLALTLVGFTVALALVPLEPLGMRSAMTATNALAIFAVLISFAPFGAALMTLVASFTRSYKEAQTYLTLVLLLPTLPLVFATLFELRPAPGLMWIPSLSQHLIVSTLLRAEPVSAGAVLASAGGSLIASVLVGWIAVRLYRREALLG